LPSPDSHGQAALMLCESLLHLLVEQNVITKEKAIEMIGRCRRTGKRDDGAQHKAYQEPRRELQHGRAC